MSIVKYQCNTIGKNVFDAVWNNEGRETLENYILNKHGKKGNFESRTKVEMNIYYGENRAGSYDVEGGLSDIIVEPWEKYEE